MKTVNTINLSIVYLDDASIVERQVKRFRNASKWIQGYQRQRKIDG